MLSLAFAGCGKGEAVNKKYPPRLPEKFQTDMIITANEKEYRAFLEYYGFGNCTIKFTYPESLKNLSAVWKENICTLSYNGLTYDVETDKLPEKFFGKNAVSAVDKLFDLDSLSITHSGNSWVYKGKTGENDFELSQNAETGAFESLKFPELKIDISFQNFKEIKEN